MPGPRPTPTHLKLLRGNPGKQKLNAEEPRPPQPPALLEPPEFLKWVRQKTNGGGSPASFMCSAC